MKFAATQRHVFPRAASPKFDVTNSRGVDGHATRTRFRPSRERASSKLIAMSQGKIQFGIIRIADQPFGAMARSRGIEKSLLRPEQLALCELLVAAQKKAGL